VHIYARPGTYTATLTVTDVRGYSSTPTTKSRKVVNARPHATFISGVRKHTVTFRAGKSKDADGRIVSYVWHFGDGKTARGATVKHTYSKTKSYRATLTVTDNSRAKTTVAHTITTKRR
jgi:PKD repeat protein